MACLLKHDRLDYVAWQKAVWNAELPALPTWHPAIIARNHGMGFPPIDNRAVGIPHFASLLDSWAKSDAMFSNCRTRYSLSSRKRPGGSEFAGFAARTISDESWTLCALALRPDSRQRDAKLLNHARDPVDDVNAMFHQQCWRRLAQRLIN
jgi:hypothetical protein